VRPATGALQRPSRPDYGRTEASIHREYAAAAGIAVGLDRFSPRPTCAAASRLRIARSRRGARPRRRERGADHYGPDQVPRVRLRLRPRPAGDGEIMAKPVRHHPEPSAPLARATFELNLLLSTERRCSCPALARSGSPAPTGGVLVPFRFGVDCLGRYAALYDGAPSNRRFGNVNRFRDRRPGPSPPGRCSACARAGQHGQPSDELLGVPGTANAHVRSRATSSPGSATNIRAARPAVPAGGSSAAPGRHHLAGGWTSAPLPPNRLVRCTPASPLDESRQTGFELASTANRRDPTPTPDEAAPHPRGHRSAGTRYREGSPRP